MKIEVGKTYDVNHRHQSRLTIKVTHVNNKNISCTIIKGKAYFASQIARTPGDHVVINKDLSTFTLVD